MTILGTDPYVQQKVTLLTLFVCLFQTSIILFYHRSLDYLVSSSWLHKFCQIQVPSYRVRLKSIQTLIVYSHKLWAYHILQSGQIVGQGFIARLVSTFLFQLPKSIFCIKKTRMQARGSTSLTSPCLMNCVVIVFSLRVPLSVF